MKRILDFFNSCDEVWIPQAQVEETVREYGFKGPLTVVENGNDFASIITGNPAEYKLAARHRLGVKDDELALLFVGQHIWEKGIDVILETLRLLKGEIKFVMNFIGTGYALNDVRSLVSRYGMSDSVHINGVIKDRHTLSDYYAASDLFLFPSFYDNAPLVVREAAAMGTPAILLEGSTAAEVICDRKNGFLTEKSPERFSELIIHLKNNRDLLNRVSEGARTTLVRSWEDVVDEVSRKMIRRHPHVFGTSSADTSEEALQNWEEIKKEEKQGKEWIVSPLREVPQELPALTRAAKVLKKIDKTYEKGSSYEQNVEALQKAVDALKVCGHEPYNKELEQIMANILVRLSDIARITKISSEQVLTDRIEDLIDQYEKMEKA